MTSASQSVVVQQRVKTLTIIFYAILLSQIIFMAVATVVQRDVDHVDAETAAIFKIAVPVYTIAVIAAAFFLRRSRLAAAQAMGSPEEKVASYVTSVIISLALIEGGSLLSTVAYMLTGNYVFFGTWAAALLALSTLKPSAEKMGTELGLS